MIKKGLDIRRTQENSCSLASYYPICNKREIIWRETYRRVKQGAG